MGPGTVGAFGCQEFFKRLQGDGVPLPSYGRDTGPLVGGAQREAGVGELGLQAARQCFHRSVGDAQFRMVEGCALEANAVVGEGFDERYEGGAVVALRLGEDTAADIPLREVSAALIEVHDLLESRLSAVVKIGTGKFDVAQPGRFEDSVGGVLLIRIAGDRRREWVPEIVLTAQLVVGGGPNTRAEEARLDSGATAAPSGASAITSCVADACIGGPGPPWQAVHWPRP